MKWQIPLCYSETGFSICRVWKLFSLHELRFQIDLGHDADDLALHFNPRFHDDTDGAVVVCNSKTGGCWGDEKRGIENPLQRGTDVKVMSCFLTYCFIWRGVRMFASFLTEHVLCFSSRWRWMETCLKWSFLVSRKSTSRTASAWTWSATSESEETSNWLLSRSAERHNSCTTRVLCSSVSLTRG